MTDNSNWFLGVVAFIYGLPGAINAWLNLQIHKTIKHVDTQVTTMNNQTAAELLDATETRRIRNLDTEDLTRSDRSHMRSVEEREDDE